MTFPLIIRASDRLEACGSGLFVSRGQGRHPARVNDTWELFHIRRGELHLSVAGSKYVVAANHVLVVAPGEKIIGSQDYERHLEYSWLHFRLHLKSARRAELIRIPRLSTIARPGRLTDLLGFLQEDTHRKTITSHAGHCLLHLILSELTEAQRQPDSGSVLAQAAVTWMAQHHHEPISVSDVAHAVSCHPDHLGRVFRAAHGHSVGSRIQGYRIDHACRLLEDTDLSMAEIITKLGWQAASQFRAIFQRRMGMSPIAWRKQRRGRRVYVNTE